MKDTRHDPEQRRREVERVAGVAGASVRLAKLTRQLEELDADAHHWLDRGNTRFALGCVAEAAEIRKEIEFLADTKFAERAKPKTVTFEREPARLAKAPAVLRHHVEKLMTRNGWTRWVDAFQRIHGRALDDLLAIGRRKADRKGLMSNVGERIS